MRTEMWNHRTGKVRVDRAGRQFPLRLRDGWRRAVNVTANVMLSLLYAVPDLSPTDGMDDLLRKWRSACVRRIHSADPSTFNEICEDETLVPDPREVMREIAPWWTLLAHGKSLRHEMSFTVLAAFEDGRRTIDALLRRDGAAKGDPTSQAWRVYVAMEEMLLLEAWDGIVKALYGGDMVEAFRRAPQL